MRQSSRLQRGFKLATLLAGHSATCLVCCMAYPHFVGPVDLIKHALPPDDPTSRIERALSPAGTEAYVEINRPQHGFPGSIVVDVVNETSKPMRNVVVTYALQHPIVVDHRQLDRHITVTSTEIQTHFETADPAVECSRTLDYRSQTW